MVVRLKKTLQIGLIVFSAMSANAVNANEFNDIPNWVLNPSVEGGIAAVDCVAFSGNMSSDSKLAALNARAALAQQIETQVESIDEVFDSRSTAGTATTNSSSFSSTAKQMSKQLLRGSKVTRSDIVKIMNANYFCSMATLDPSKTQTFFKDLLQQMELSLPKSEQASLLEALTTPSHLPPKQQVAAVTDK